MFNDNYRVNTSEHFPQIIDNSDGHLFLYNARGTQNTFILNPIRLTQTDTKFFDSPELKDRCI
jgi:hypothetical protein